MAIKASVLALVVAAGITATSPEQEVKKAYFKAAKGPLSKSMYPELIKALEGDTSVVVDDSATAGAPAASKPKAEKAPKTTEAPKQPKTTETPEQALARLKSDPATSARWARVQSVLEMGKRGPVRVRIVCDDKGENGETLTRDIKVQDLFQVRYSEGFQKKNARKRKEATKPAATTDTQ